jgi:hypothetical protein
MTGFFMMGPLPWMRSLAELGAGLCWLLVADVWGAALFGGALSGPFVLLVLLVLLVLVVDPWRSAMPAVPGARLWPDATEAVGVVVAEPTVAPVSAPFPGRAALAAGAVLAAGAAVALTGARTAALTGARTAALRGARTAALTLAVALAVALARAGAGKNPPVITIAAAVAIPATERADNRPSFMKVPLRRRSV